MDEVLLDPTPEQLGRAVARVIGRVNARRDAVYHPHAAGHYAEPPADRLAAAVGRMAGEPAGETRFPPQVLGRGASRAELATGVAWWTDPGRRRHVRAWAEYEPDDDEERGVPPADLPPVCRAYPGAVFAVRVGTVPEVRLVACGCGNVGSADALGWSGDRCGPCADARDEGRDGPCPAVLYGLSPMGGAGRVRFAPDGSGLVADGQDGRLAWIDARTGRRTESDGHPDWDTLAGLAIAPDGRAVLAAYRSGHLNRWDVAAGTFTRYGRVGPFGRPTANTDDRHLVTDGGRACHRIDWADPARPTAPQFDWPDLRGGGFAGGGEWVALTAAGAFVSVDPATGRRSLLRDAATAGLDAGPGAIDVFAIDPDHDRVVVGVVDAADDPVGPAWLGAVRGPADWRPLPVGADRHGNLRAVHGFTPDGAWVLYDTGDGLAVHPTAAGQPVVIAGLTAGGPVRPAAVAFSPDGETLACQVPAIGGLWLLPWKRLLAAAGLPTS